MLGVGCSVLGSGSGLPIFSATFGHNERKRLFCYGLRTGILLTCSGFVVDLILAPGNCNDSHMLANYLDECVEADRSLVGQAWVMDKGFRNRAIVAWAKQRQGLDPLPRQQDPADSPPSYWQLTLDRVRKPIEGVISFHTECLGIEHTRAKTDWGLYRRVQAKATAVALARYFNRTLGLEAMNFARYAV